MKHNSGTYRVTKPELRALISFAHATNKKYPRPQLSCVHFAPAIGGAYATDGHSLLKVANGSTSTVPPFTAPLQLLQDAYRLMGAKAEAEISHTDGVAAVYVGEARLTGLVVEEQGPWESVENIIPSTDKFMEGALLAPVIGLDAKFLARLLIVQIAASAKGVSCYRGGDVLDPQLFRIEGSELDVTWTAVLMPMRL